MGRQYSNTVPVFTSSGHVYLHGLMDQPIHILKGLFSLDLPSCPVSSEQSHWPNRGRWERKYTCSKVQFQTTEIPPNRSRCGPKGHSYSLLDRPREFIHVRRLQLVSLRIYKQRTFRPARNRVCQQGQLHPSFHLNPQACYGHGSEQVLFAVVFSFKAPKQQDHHQITFLVHVLLCTFQVSH